MKLARLTLAALLFGAVNPAPPLAAQEPAPPAPAPTPAPQPRDERPALELTLDEVVERALKNNTDIAVQRFDPEISEADVRAVQGSYDPILSAEVTRSSAVDANPFVFSGGTRIESDAYDWNFGAQQLLGTGGTLVLQFRNARSTSTSPTVALDPLYNPTLSASLTQPLLRDFAIDQTRERLSIAKLNRQISDAQFKQIVTNIVALAKQQYYDITFAHDNLAAQRKSLALAERLLEENRIKVRVGTLAPLDVVAAEAEVASREEAVIQAEALLQQVEDNLKRTILPGNDTAAWGLRIVTKERPSAAPPQIDVEAAVRNALENRTDLLAARKGVESSAVSLRFARNQLKPSLDLIASYSAEGLSGTAQPGAFPDGAPLPPSGGYGDSLSQVFGRDFPSWRIGVNFSYPLFNRAAKGAEARSRLSKEQAEASVRRLELAVATEVRAAARNVETGYKRVEATRAARVLAARRLEAEQKRFDAGMSTNFLVTQAQRDLAVAEVNEISAIADYTQAAIDFERSQQAGGGSVASATASRN